MSFLTAFNNQLCNLVNNLSDMFPEDPDLQFSKNTVAFLKKNNPRKLQKIFSEYVGIYKNQIKEEDDKFFLTKDFIKEDLDFDSNHYSNDIMKNLKKYWHLIDTESKKNIWKYLKVLVILNDKCNNA
jgi:type I site-specific restriction-modification system R (restriction) subunit